MRQPHFLQAALLLPDLAASYMVMCLYSLALASLPSSPYMPSQINRSACSAYSAMTGTGLVSVQ